MTRTTEHTKTTCEPLNKVQLKSVLLFLVILIATSCQRTEKDYSQPLYSELDIQGHRGCRGSLPENSMAGFIQALEWGVTTLEMDVVISQDQKVVLSHEPFMSHKICLDHDGNEIDSTDRFKYNIYQMTYQEIKSYDCGSKPPPGFPNQQQQAGPKPLLEEVIQKIEAQTKVLGRKPVMYNIELKSSAGFDNIFHPEPSRFVELVLSVVNQNLINQRTVIQSFDPRILQKVRKQQPDLKTSLLVSGGLGPLHDFIQLGFKPDIYSPNHIKVTDSMVQNLHEQNIAVVPWTVNDTTTMARLIKTGVDGIITDYPERLLKLVGRR